MAEQRDIEDKGGTMRLGSYECKLTKGSHAFKAYGKIDITERHRHRYEFNNTFKAELEKVGLRPTGVHPSRNLVEIVELQDHPWFVGVQFHPELKSTVSAPHPLFVDFVSASLAYSTSTTDRVSEDKTHVSTEDASLKAPLSS
jgi:CTP synthase